MISEHTISESKFEFRVLDLSKYKNVQFIGDLHGNIISAVWEITNRKKFKDTLVIVCGDIGMGFESITHYLQKWKRIANDLKENNNHIACIRGNHDDPLYFEKDSSVYIQLEDAFGGQISFISDYEYLCTSIGGILCIGGAVSIDRSGNHRIKDYSWWMNENVKELSNDELDYLVSIIVRTEYLKNYPLRIVCSHSSPRGAWPINPSFEDQGQAINSWSVHDSKLKEDCWNEREYLRHVQDILLNNPDIAKTLKAWVYGHFHQHFESGYEIYYIALDMFRQTGFIDALNDTKRILSDWLDGKKFLKSLEEQNN